MLNIGFAIKLVRVALGAINSKLGLEHWHSTAVLLLETIYCTYFMLLTYLTYSSSNTISSVRYKIIWEAIKAYLPNACI